MDNGYGYNDKNTSGSGNTESNISGVDSQKNNVNENNFRTDPEETSQNQTGNDYFRDNKDAASENNASFDSASQSSGTVYGNQQNTGDSQYRYNYDNRQNYNGQYGNGYSQQYSQYGERTQYGHEGQYNYNSDGRYGDYYYRQQQQQQQQPPKKKKAGASKGFVISMVAIGMVLCLMIGAFGAAAYYKFRENDLSKPTGSGSVIIQGGNKSEKPPVTDKGSVAYVNSIVADSVVEITTETAATDSFFGQYVKQGAGSGVIISSGDTGTYIITCAHVIEGATKVQVTLKNGEQYEAVSKSSDPQTDIGIVKIDVKGLKPALIGDFSKVVVGEEVVAIGNPLGELGGSVTNGIVSALDRDIMIDGTTYHLLQTNAEINPGNSGGGLFNMDGKLIGIVNAKSAGDHVEGLGFAIPIDEAVKIAKELIENGYVTGRVKLGFTLVEFQDEKDLQRLWRYSRFFTDYGVYIIESENKEFHLGDRIVAIKPSDAENSITVSSLGELKDMLLDFEVGQKITITVSRINSHNKCEMIDIELELKEAGTKNKFLKFFGK